MDRIRIKDLQVYGFHGVNFQEKDMGQMFYISLDVFLDIRKAATHDSINDTVSYAQLSVDVEKEFNRKKYDLIEKAAEELAKFVLINYDSVDRIIVEVKKPWAPIGKSLDYASVQIDRCWHTAFIAIGSNLGDKNDNLLKAIDLLKKPDVCKVVKVSNFYDTKPVGFLDQEDFLNGALELKTLLTPEELMDKLLEIEKELKRERMFKWGPRTIDLDIIFYDDLISYDEKIILPHPRMQERIFVLKPLCDIAPYYLHPVLKRRIIELLEDCEE
jgi:dihydroneopterin aldolase/2-amino-4-hydroxy-6-hydroxymethyldihydropteridine diphosphokinase